MLVWYTPSMSQFEYKKVNVDPQEPSRRELLQILEKDQPLTGAHEKGIISDLVGACANAKEFEALLGLCKHELLIPYLTHYDSLRAMPARVTLKEAALACLLYTSDAADE